MYEMRNRIGLMTGMITATLVAAFVTTAVFAQSTVDESPAATDVSTPPTGDVPSLDELLGIEEADGENTDSDTAREQQEKELQRRLAEKEIGDAFHQAIDKMQLSAELLDVRYDSGLGTQRLQEEIIAGLDQILEQAKKMMQKQMSSSSSSSSQQQQQQQTPGPKQQEQQQNQQSDSNSERPKGPSESNATDGPPLREGDINTVIEESRVEWGSLPERVREELYQGRQEKFSSIYDRLTREYYKRLAEDSTP